MAKKKDKKDNKKDALQGMIDYTYRDMGQEFIMRRKMLRAIVLMIITMIALVVFIALYIDERQKVQETYRKQYVKAIETADDEIKGYLNADGDLDYRYRMIFTSMAEARVFAFLRKDFVDNQKSINELYTVFLKYPDQTRERMEEVKVLLDDILSEKREAYDNINEFVDSIYKKGY